MSGYPTDAEIRHELEEWDVDPATAMAGDVLVAVTRIRWRDESDRLLELLRADGHYDEPDGPVSEEEQRQRIVRFRELAQQAWEEIDAEWGEA
jgi:hypothetical protein